ncbi:MAG: hypothetical protein ACUZ8A_04595 [Candidatus Bathyanammoxibius sp.]
MGMVLYIDNCVWQRFFELLTTGEMQKEKEDADKLLKLRRKGKIRIASSDANEAEFMPLINKGLGAKKDAIWKFVRENTDIHLTTSYGTFDNHPKWKVANTSGFSRRETECLIGYLTTQGVKHDDAVHLATAIEECVSIFVTVDKKLIRNAQNIKDNVKKKVAHKNPAEQLKKIIGASPTDPIKFLSPEEALREVT